MQDGNLPSEVVWTGTTGREYSADQLLELAAEMRLEHNADTYRQEATHADASSDDDAEADDEGEEQDEEIRPFGLPASD